MRALTSVAFAALLLSFGCSADPNEVEVARPASEKLAFSAARSPDRSFDDLVADHRAALDRGKADGTSIVYDRRVPYADLDLSTLPVWTADQLAEGFALVRDSRFMRAAAPEELVRRISFLYPDDGCFARSRSMDWLLEASGFDRPRNVFTFGDLVVQTANHPDGQVSWWFHVAPVVSVDGTAYVLDPALDPSGPLALDAWISLQGTLTDVDVSLCTGFVNTPDGDCDAPDTSETGSQAVGEEYWYLVSEWDRQVELGRDPQAVLGDAPPWATP